MAVDIKVKSSNVQESAMKQKTEEDVRRDNKVDDESTTTSSEEESGDESSNSDSSVEGFWSVTHPETVQKKQTFKRFTKLSVTDVGYYTMWIFCFVSALMSGIAVLVYFKCDGYDRVPTDFKKERVFEATYNFTDSYNSTDYTKPFYAYRVAVIQADPKECETDETFAEVVMEIERKYKHVYNFMITTDGNIHNYLGWNRTSPMYPDVPTMVVALLERCDDKTPTATQVDVLGSLLFFSEDLGYLQLFYTKFGNKMKDLPLSFHF